MAQWKELLNEPHDLGETHADYAAWFTRIAERLLNGCRFMVNDVAHRFTEIEFYYHGGAHLDTFTHRDPIQKGTGMWYFHRTAGVYRGGSFKGLDLTFGGGHAHGGVLIRGIEQEDGPLIDGPSLTVDHLLQATGAASVARLDEAIDGRAAWDRDNVLHLEWAEMAERPLLRTARVGLSLKKLKHSEGPPRFLIKPYRALSEARRIAKGKQHMVLAMHMAGASALEIREATGCTKGAIDRYIADYEEGAKEEGFAAYFGAELGPKELARLHGLWKVKHG